MSISKKVLRIGIVGCGAIGSSLARAVARDFRGKASLAGVHDADPAKAVSLARRLGSPALAVSDLQTLVRRSELIVEAASAGASAGIARRALRSGRSVMVMSVGGLLAEGLAVFERMCRRYGGRLYIPSGAIAGIDGLRAASVAGVRSVTLRTIKHPRSFKGVEYVRRKGVDLDGIKESLVLFSGSAGEAVKRFPQNINVAAVLSLAGIGARKTKVEIIASPLATKNIHEIIIESVSARITARTENSVHPENPKTSYLAVLSAIALLKRIVDEVQAGT